MGWTRQEFGNSVFRCTRNQGHTGIRRASDPARGGYVAYSWNRTARNTDVPQSSTTRLPRQQALAIAPWKSPVSELSSMAGLPGLDSLGTPRSRGIWTALCPRAAGQILAMSRPRALPPRSGNSVPRLGYRCGPSLPPREGGGELLPEEETPLRAGPGRPSPTMGRPSPAAGRPSPAAGRPSGAREGRTARGRRAGRRTSYRTVVWPWTTGLRRGTAGPERPPTPGRIPRRRRGHVPARMRAPRSRRSPGPRTRRRHCAGARCWWRGPDDGPGSG